MKKLNKLKKLTDNGLLDALFVIVLFLMTYIPFLLLGMYNHSNTDDFWMSVGVHHTFVETGSLIAAFKRAVSDCIWIWKSWDGCFLSMLFTILSPVAFSEDLYCIVYPIISASLFIGTGAFAYMILRKILRMEKFSFIAVWLMMVIMMIQFVPYYGEAYYWWPGAVNYTFFFSVFLLTQSLVAGYLYTGRKSYIVSACLTGFCTGLGNLMTALVGAFVIFLEMLFFNAILKKKNRNGMHIILAAAFAGLMINVLAPGNTIRGGSNLFDNSVINAVISAITGATYFIGAYFKKTMTVYVLLLAAVIYKAMGNIKTDFRFKLPGLFFIISYGVYCALWAPVTYTGVQIYARLGNQLFLGQMLLLTANLVYFCGWLHKNVVKKRRMWVENTAVFVCMAILVAYFIPNSYLYNSEAARVQVISGNARQFDEQVDERFDLYYDDTIKDVYVKPVEYIPGLFFYTDTSFDSLTDYFNKNFIEVIEDAD